MIQVLPIRNDIKNNPISLRTHILTPRLGVTFTLTIEGKKENIVSILEDHLLETISAVEWNPEEINKDFEFITENYNRFIKNLEPTDLADISIAISVLYNNDLIISTIGNSTAYLAEWDVISGISMPEKGRLDFHTLTSGDVSRNASIYISNKDLYDVLWDDLILDFSNMTGQEFSQVAKEMFAREIDFPFHITRIAHPFQSTQKEVRPRARGQLDLIKNKSLDVASQIKNHPVWGKIQKNVSDKLDNVDFVNNKQQKFAFLGVGIVVIFFLIYSLFSLAGNILGSSGDTAKDSILQAKTLIEDSQKLTSDQWAFETNIKQAEEILANLRSQQKYLTDTQELQSRIDVLKKEVYGIETIDLAKKESIVPLENTGLEPIATFEYNNKLTIIGKSGMVSDYVRGHPLPQIITYPGDTTAISADINGSGTPYIISEAGNVMIRQKDAVVNASLSGQATWEVGSKITSYDSNLYIVNSESNQIYRYKGGTNGFLQKSNILPQLTSSKILDIGVDGGFYILTADGKIGRYLGVKEADGITPLTLNKIPGSWIVNASEPTQIVATERLSYVYIRNGKKIWVFQPNSRQFRDINALTYIAQIEIQTDNEITHISVPRDGIFYISTNKGIYDNQFEVKDGKFFLK